MFMDRNTSLCRFFDLQPLKIQNGQFHTYCINVNGIVHQIEKGGFIIFLFSGSLTMSSTTLLSSVTNNVSSTLGPNVSTSTLEPSVTPNFTITTLFPPNSTLFPNDTNLTTDGYRPETPEEALRDFWIGLCLAVTSAVFTGSSFILKKKGLLNVSKRSATRAGMYVYS